VSCYLASMPTTSIVARSVNRSHRWSEQSVDLHTVTYWPACRRYVPGPCAGIDDRRRGTAYASSFPGPAGPTIAILADGKVNPAAQAASIDRSGQGKPQTRPASTILPLHRCKPAETTGRRRCLPLLNVAVSSR
jgi:hypothetical protein